MYVLQVEETLRLLLQVPALVDLYEAKDNDLFSTLKMWLERVETHLMQMRNSTASDIAVLRGSLLRTRRGSRPQTTGTMERLSPRQAAFDKAFSVLGKSQELLAGLNRPLLARIDDAQRLMNQLSYLAKLKGIVPSPPPTSRPESTLDAWWEACCLEKDLVALTLQIIGLVTRRDALVLLDRALERV